MSDVHAFDGRIDPEAKRRVDEEATNGGDEKDFAAVAARVTGVARDADGVNGKRLDSIRTAVEAYANVGNPWDVRNQVDVRAAFRLAWRLCEGDSSLRDVFYSQLDDMVATNGTCHQGLSSRMLQLVLALHDE